MNAILAIARADVAERMRRFTFILTIAAALYAGYLYVPEATSAYHTVVIHGHTGIFNSAFYGATIAALTSGFLTLLGFFIVRGAIERDVECHVDGIVAASPVRKRTFVLAKWLSNASVLWAIGGLSYLAAMAMQILRGQALQVDVAAFVMPYLLVTVPAMAFVAAIATVFDLVPFLRGILGGAIFVMLWPVMLAVPLTAKGIVQANDPLGFTVISSNLIAAERHAFPVSSSPDINFGVLLTKHLGESFLFSGFTWTGAVVAQRLMWLTIAVAMVVFASILFDRFRRENVRSRQSAFIDLARFIPNVSFLRIFRAEFGLIANGASMWWYLGVLGILAAGAFVPLAAVTKVVLPLALIWPLERISALGARERKFGVEDIVSSTSGFATKTVAFQWAAGGLLVFILCLSCVMRLGLAGDAAGIIACIALALSISALALALGTTSGASRPFEALFLILWYLGPVQHAPGIDFATGLLTAPLAESVVCSIVAVAALSVTRVRRTAR